ncbi:MAG: S1 RNA-binding domain-containing protein, partial [Armatimonadetes bacterium]|nr:S1 RNA-binding domain-containing protein [Anaerolineae bacterium]
NEDWKIAEDLMQKEEVWRGIVADANRGGLIVLFGNLRGFVPASHVADLPRGLGEDDRRVYLMRLIGQPVNVKVIEVNRKRRRLVFSQRDASRGSREARKEVLLEELKEGEVRKGVVSGLRDFGAFVDLGGADGLIHISELAWHRVKHPREILNVGDEVTVYILRLDDEGKRIGLSLKRLQPNPWSMVDEMYHVGQLVEGNISRLSDFGAFVSMEPGVEALLHISQIADPAPANPSEYVRETERLLMRVISIESDKQRLGLSLKEVTTEEIARWREQNPNTQITNEVSTKHPYQAPTEAGDVTEIEETIQARDTMETRETMQDAEAATQSDHSAVPQDTVQLATESEEIPAETAL